VTDPADHIPALHPDRTALLRTLRDRVSRGMLATIAAADYGMDVEEHLAALEKIHATLEVPDELGWCPGEVPTEGRPFLIAAMLLLLAHRSREEEADIARDFARWLIEEDRVRRRWGVNDAAYVSPWGWLLGTTFHDLKHTTWRALARTILIEGRHPVGSQAALRDIGRRLTEQSSHADS
jgi:hypothetical protein